MTQSKPTTTQPAGGVGNAGATGKARKGATGRANTLVTLLTHLQHSLDTAEGKATRAGVAGPQAVENRIDVAYLRGRRDMVKELLVSGGLVESQAGIQVLFMLPAAFVRAYAGLFERTLREAGGAVSGKGIEHDRGSGKAKGRSGMALGSENALQAKGGGKKWKEQQLPINSSQLLSFKTSLDVELLELSGRIEARMKAGKGSSAGGAGVCKGVGCKRFTRREWKFCPSCGTQLAG